MCKPTHDPTGYKLEGDAHTLQRRHPRPDSPPTHNRSAALWRSTRTAKRLVRTACNAPSRPQDALDKVFHKAPTGTEHDMLQAVYRWAAARHNQAAVPRFTAEALRLPANARLGGRMGLQRLPLFEDLATLWTLLLEGGGLPPWRDIRSVAIPTQGGAGLRRLGAAATAWRMGVGVIVDQFSDWIGGWAPVQAMGAVRSRRSRRVAGHLGRSPPRVEKQGDGDRRRHARLAKCFDKVGRSKSNELLVLLGCPASVEDLLERCDQQQCKWMEAQSCVDQANGSCFLRRNGPRVCQRFP